MRGEGRDEISRSPLFKGVLGYLCEGWTRFRDNMRLLVVRSLLLNNKRLAFMNISLEDYGEQVPTDSQAGNKKERRRNRAPTKILMVYDLVLKY